MRLLICYGIGFLLVTILNIVINKKSKKFKDKIRWEHYFFGYLFMLYLLIALSEVVGFPTLYRWQKILSLNQPIFNPTINLIPFNDGFEISTILNIIFFMPFGFLLPTLWEKYRKFWPTLSMGILFSLIIEISQLFVPYRATDINDLIMNTIGTLCGWLIFNVMSKIFHKLITETALESSTHNTISIKIEPYLYIIIALIGAFLS